MPSKFFLIIILFSCLVYSQGRDNIIRNVDSELVNDGRIQITYYLNPEDQDDSFIISASVELDSGRKINLESVSGDVGYGISGRGRKTIFWDVFNQLDYFQGENLVFYVKAEKMNPVRETVTRNYEEMEEEFPNIFTGTEETQEHVNGVIIFIGYPSYSFHNDFYDSNIDKGILNKRNAWDVGVRYQELPFIFTFDYALTKYDLDLNLPQEDKLNARYESLSGELNLSILPIYKQITPSFGGGYQYGILHSGDYESWVETSGFYLNGMIEINVGFLSFSAAYRASVSGKESRQWDQFLLTAGINFGSTDSKNNSD